MTAIIEPHIPALKHLFASMAISSSRFSLRFFFHCAKTCFADSLDHFFNVGFPFLKMDHCLFLIEAHISLLHSVEPFQGRFHRNGASASGHPLDSQRHCFKAVRFTRVDTGSICRYRPGAQQYRQAHNNHECLFHMNPPDLHGTLQNVRCELRENI